MKELNELRKQISEMLKQHKSQGCYDTSKINISAKAKKVLLDLDKNHNTSFAVETFLRSEKFIDSIAINYRGNNFTYGYLWKKVFAYAKSLKSLGFGEDSEIPVCVSNMPEFVYLFLAANLIGAKLNVFGKWFDDDYTKFILNNSGSSTVFVSDDIYDKIKDKVDASMIKNIVVFSLADSLKNGNPYQEIDDMFHPKLFESKFSDIKENSSKTVFSTLDFEKIGSNYLQNVVADSCLDTPAIITYTSGTTSPGVPKAVLHSNRSYMTISRFKDKDITSLTSMDGVKVLHQVPTYTHMNLCSFTDSLFHGCEMCLEPVYDKDFFKYSAIMYQPNYQPSTFAFNYELCYALEHDEDFRKLCDGLSGHNYRNGQLGNLIAPTIVGEGLDKGSEKYFNKVARKHRFGVDKLHFPVCYSIGGGTGEASGVFTTLFKEYLSKMPPYVFSKDSLGINPLPFAEVVTINKDGNYCKANEPGIIGINSPCNMVGYYYQDKLPKLKDENPFMEMHDGKRYLIMNNVGIITPTGSLKIKDRLGNEMVLSDGTKIPLYQVSDCILSDTKNIMSGSIVKINDEIIGEAYVMHIVLQPGVKNKDKVLNGIARRLNSVFSKEVLDRLYIRIRSNEEAFPITPSGKRDNIQLSMEGYTEKCVSVTNLLYVNSKRKGNVLTR